MSKYWKEQTRGSQKRNGSMPVDESLPEQDLRAAAARDRKELQQGQARGIHPARDLHGVQRRIALGGFTVSEIRHPPGLAIDEHWHSTAQFAIVMAGTFSEGVGERVWNYPAGTVLFWAPGAVHRNLPGRVEARALMVELSSEQYARASRVLPHGWVPCCLHVSAFGDVPARLIEEFNSSEPAARLAMEGLILELIARASRLLSLQEPPKWLEEAKALLEKETAAAPNLGALAKAIRVPAARLAREFRRYYGSSVGEAIRRLRLQRAMTALRETPLSISEIAPMCGFYDQAHLAREFRSSIGLTPSEFRMGKRRSDETRTKMAPRRPIRRA